MCIKRVADRARVVTRFTVEQSSPNENVDLRFAQLNRQTTHAPPSAVTMQAHACSGRTWGANRVAHGLSTNQKIVNSVQKIVAVAG
jgi:hypothetical protein